VSRASLLLLALCLAGCSGVSDQVKDSAEHVLTLRQGTMTDLRRRVGTGPYRVYEVAPDEMLGVLEDAARKARGKGGRPVSAVFVSEFRREIVAKERAPDEADDDGYSKPFLSAMLANVWAVDGRADASRVEIHAIRSGPFHKGAVAWERDMPRWIDEVLQARRAVADAPLAPLPARAPDEVPAEVPAGAIKPIP